VQQNGAPERLFFVKRALFLSATILLGLLQAGAASASDLVYSVYSPYEDHRVRTGIYVSQPDGSGRTRLTRGGRDFGATWSPDRSRIAFVRTRYQEGAPSRSFLMVMRPDGSQKTRISQLDPTSYSSRGFDWSPDSRRLAFARDGDIYVADRSGMNERRLTETVPGEGDPTWSPDNLTIAFTGTTVGADSLGVGTNADIYVVDAAGGAPRQITSDAQDDFQARWSPDGEQLGFLRFQECCVGSETYWSDLFVIDADGTGETQLTNDCTFDEGHEWLPDGSGLVYGAYADDDACGIDYTGSSLRIVRLRDAGVTEVLPEKWAAGGIAMSRRGRWVVFSAGRNDTVDLFRVRLRDGLVRRITQSERKAHDVDPDW
jgi:TolB protein